MDKENLIVVLYGKPLSKFYQRLYLRKAFEEGVQYIHYPLKNLRVAAGRLKLLLCAVQRAISASTMALMRCALLSL